METNRVVRAVRRILGQVAAIMFLATSHLGAQAPAAPAAPDRYARMRHVDLGSGSSVWVGFGGQIRERAETWSSFNFGAPGTTNPAVDPDDAFLLTRIQASADLHLGGHFRVFAQAKSSLLSNRTLGCPSGNCPANALRPFHDELDFEQAYAELRLTHVSHGALALRGGRMELAFGRERLVSSLDWANTKRNFDGVSAIYSTTSSNVTAFWSRPILVNYYGIDRRDSSVALYGLYATKRPASRNLGVDLYWLGQRRGAATWNGTSGRENRQTLGGRVWGPIRGAGALDCEVEAAVQLGSVGDSSISALMGTAVLGYTFAHAPGRLRIYGSVDFASGDDTLGGKVHTFSQLNPQPHPFLGFADIAGRQNVLDLSGGGSARLWRTMTGALDYHLIRRVHSGDAFYALSGAVSRAAAAAANSNAVASELDLTLRYPVDRYLLLATGFSYVSAGTFIKQVGAASGSTKSISFGYLTLQYTL